MGDGSFLPHLTVGSSFCCGVAELQYKLEWSDHSSNAQCVPRISNASAADEEKAMEVASSQIFLNQY